MGIFSAWKATNSYEDALRRYGVDPYSLSANLHGQICSYVNQQHESNIRLLGKFYVSQVPLEAQMRNAAALVAICVLGPTKSYQYQAEKDVYERFLGIASDLKNEKTNSSLDFMIVKSISDSGFLHTEFVRAVDALL